MCGCVWSVQPLYLVTLYFSPQLHLKGLPNLGDRFVQYGIKVSFWGSGTLKIVIYVENYPQKRGFWLAYYHPLWGVGVLISGHNIYTYHICTKSSG